MSYTYDRTAATSMMWGEHLVRTWIPEVIDYVFRVLANQLDYTGVERKRPMEVHYKFRADSGADVTIVIAAEAQSDCVFITVDGIANGRRPKTIFTQRVRAFDPIDRGGALRLVKKFLSDN